MGHSGATDHVHADLEGLRVDGAAAMTQDDADETAYSAGDLGAVFNWLVKVMRDDTALEVTPTAPTGTQAVVSWSGADPVTIDNTTTSATVDLKMGAPSEIKVVVSDSVSTDNTEVATSFLERTYMYGWTTPAPPPAISRAPRWNCCFMRILVHWMRGTTFSSNLRAALACLPAFQAETSSLPTIATPIVKRPALH